MFHTWLPCCLGTHVSNTSEIGAFKVVSESGVASGVRRIEAVAGQAAVEYLQSLDAIVKQLAASLRAKAEDLPTRIGALQVSCSTTLRHVHDACIVMSSVCMWELM
jgi:alanyl-tRNA synthetase